MSEKSKKEATVASSRLPASPAGEMPEAQDARSLKSAEPVAGGNDRWRVPAVCLFLAAITFVVFGQTRHFEFLNFDDNVYVYENPAVMHGLSLKGVGWAFTHIVESNWHPLTMLSHMLDCQWHGLKAGEHHLTNVLLHTASVILLFLVLRRMTGFLWRSAFVAAVFAIHPLRVESVAWVAERKDVLSGLFFMLTLWAYACYAQGVTGVAGRRSLFYGLVLLFLALGLMSKPTVVTLPFVLLLLDYWPLNRFAVPAPAVAGKGDSLKNHFLPRRLILEKIPLLALTGAACVATMLAQKEAIVSAPLALRAGNAVMSYVVYLRQMFCPTGLAVLYPYPQSSPPGWEITAAVVLLAAVSAGAFFRRQRQPYLIIGWLWYLGMLVPAIGLVQSGLRAHADRYTYLPQIGLYVLLTWAAADLCIRWRHRWIMLGAGATVILAALIVCARTQTAYWRNSELLWTHTLACTTGNYIAHDELGNALLQKEPDKAIAQYQQALQIKPDYAWADNNLGSALLQKGKLDEAIIYFQKTLTITPDSAEAHINLGNALLQKGNADEAITQFQKVLQLKPGFAEAHISLGMALFQKGQVDEAITQYRQALQIKPDYAGASYNLGNALLQKGEADEAMACFQKALQITPDNVNAHIGFGNALLQKGQVDDAITQFQAALQLTPDNEQAHNNLGNALLQKGRENEAITQFQAALQLTPDNEQAHNNLGNLLLQAGQLDDAIIHYRKALQIKPDNAKAHNNLGIALFQKRRVKEAVAQYQAALRITPDYAEAHNNLGYALLQAGEVDEARVHFQQALQLKPDYVEARVNLGNALLKSGRVDEAIDQYQQALRMRPGNVEAQNNLGIALLQKGRFAEAKDHFQQALQLNANALNVLNNLAWLLATSPEGRLRDGAQAVQYAERACELTHRGAAPLLVTLAAAYAEAGRYDEAVTAAEKACGLAVAAGEKDLLERTQSQLALYRTRQPYHEAAKTVVPAVP